MRPRRDLPRAASTRNLNLAWERLLRSGEPAFKWYWRGAAGAAVVAWPQLRSRLQKQLRGGTFFPDGACIISEPKKSGLLRHRSLLTLGDLIVYQALTNIVADRM